MLEDLWWLMLAHTAFGHAGTNYWPDSKLQAVCWLCKSVLTRQDCNIWVQPGCSHPLTQIEHFPSGCRSLGECYDGTSLKFGSISIATRHYFDENVAIMTWNLWSILVTLCIFMLTFSDFSWWSPQFWWLLGAGLFDSPMNGASPRAMRRCMWRPQCGWCFSLDRTDRTIDEWWSLMVTDGRWWSLMVHFMMVDGWLVTLNEDWWWLMRVDDGSW